MSTPQLFCFIIMMQSIWHVKTMLCQCNQNPWQRKLPRMSTTNNQTTEQISDAYSHPLHHTRNTSNPRIIPVKSGWMTPFWSSWVSNFGDVPPFLDIAAIFFRTVLTRSERLTYETINGYLDIIVFITACPGIDSNSQSHGRFKE